MIGFVICYLLVFERVGWGFSRETVAAHLFVGSVFSTYFSSVTHFALGTEKTMTLAIPIIQILYGNNGIVLIPVIAYHSIETIVGGIMLIPLRRWIRQGKELAHTPLIQ